MTGFSTLAITALLLSSTALADTAPADTLSVAPGARPGDADRRTFATRAGHDWYLEQERIAAELEAEHLLARLHSLPDRELQGPTASDATESGEGSVAPELTRIAQALTAPGVLELLERSAYYQAVVAGQAPANGRNQP